MEISSWEISVMSPPLSWLSYIFGTFIHTNPLNSLFADTGSDLWIFTRWSLSFMWIAVAWVLKTHLWCDGISVRGEGRGVFRTWNVLRGGNLTKNKLEFLEFVLWSSTWGQWMTALPLRTTIAFLCFSGSSSFTDVRFPCPLLVVTEQDLGHADFQRETCCLQSSPCGVKRKRFACRFTAESACGTVVSFGLKRRVSVNS